MIEAVHQPREIHHFACVEQSIVGIDRQVIAGVVGDGQS